MFIELKTMNCYFTKLKKEFHTAAASYIVKLSVQMINDGKNIVIYKLDHYEWEQASK